jgi:hypothetical protein
MKKVLAVVAALLTIAAPALAEPAKRDAPKPAVQQRPAEVVLASADPAHGPMAAGNRTQSAPVRRPAPRVTTCRCGDPQADPESQEQ